VISVKFNTNFSTVYNKHREKKSRVTEIVTLLKSLRCKTSVRDLSDKKHLLTVQQETKERFVRGKGGLLTANEGPFNEDSCIPHERVSCEAHVATELRSRSPCDKLCSENFSETLSRRGCFQPS